MKVKVKLLNEKAKVPFKTYEKDFCYDVVATSCEEIAPNVYKYGLGLAFELEPKPLDTENVNLSISFRPRSSVWTTGLVLSNCVGTIDELFRGEVCAVFYHVIREMSIYNVGERIGQIHISVAPKIEFEVVDELSDTERGANGYGSTGK